MLACVVPAYNIPQSIVEMFVICNASKLISLYIVCSEDDKIKAPGATIIRSKKQEIFNIGYTCNLGIKRAIEDRAETIIKTDIDCVLSDGVLKQIQEVKKGIGFCYRYHNIDGIRGISNPRICPKSMGTICLSAQDWVYLCGYDERLKGFGYDDWHMYSRARDIAKVKIKVLCEPKVYHLEHEEKHNRDTINPILRQQNMRVEGDWIDVCGKGEWNF